MAGFNEGRAKPGGTGILGSSGSVQFKQGSTFGGDNEFNYNPTTDFLSITGTISASFLLGDGSGLTGVGSPPGTPLNSIQFNNASNFGGDADLTWTTNKLALTGTLSISGSQPLVVYGPTGENNGGPSIIARSTTSVDGVGLWEQPVSGALIVSADTWDDQGHGAVMYIHSPDEGALIGFKNVDTLVGTPLSQSNIVTDIIGKGAHVGLQRTNVVLRNEFGNVIITAHGSQELIISGPGTIIGNASTDYHQVSGTLDVSGSVKAIGFNPNRIAYSTTTTITDATVIAGVTTAGITLTLPDIASFEGTTLFIKDESGTAGSSNIILTASSGVAIDGAGTATISADYGSISTYHNGTNWFIY